MKRLIQKCPVGRTTIINNNWDDCISEDNLSQFLALLSQKTGHRYTYRYSVGKDKIAISVDDRLINKKELTERWFKSLPNKFYPVPAIISKKSFYGPIEHLYSMAEVRRIESTPEFIAEYEKIKKIQAGQGIVRTEKIEIK